MKKKKIYVNKIDNRIGNNQELCNVLEKKHKNNYDTNKSIDEKLSELFNTNGYVFNVNVQIITNDKTYNTKIASKVGDNIITLDNDIININDIKDIIF